VIEQVSQHLEVVKVHERRHYLCIHFIANVRSNECRSSRTEAVTVTMILEHTTLRAPVVH
jgi:hypothetical protein